MVNFMVYELYSKYKIKISTKRKKESISGVHHWEKNPHQVGGGGDQVSLRAITNGRNPNLDKSCKTTSKVNLTFINNDPFTWWDNA